MTANEEKKSPAPTVTKKEEASHPIVQLLFSIADGTPYVRVNELFQQIVKSAVLHDDHCPPIDIPRENMKERLRATISLVKPHLAKLIDEMDSKKQKKELEDPKLRIICLAELIRYAYHDELLRSNVLPQEFWTKKKNDIIACSVQYGVKYNAELWKGYLMAVDNKSYRIKAAKETNKQHKTEPQKQQIRLSRDYKPKSMFHEYVKAAAQSRLSDPPDLGVLAIVANGYLALAAAQLSSDQLLKFENEVITTVALVKAGLVMPKEMFEEFAKKMKTASESLMASVGTIIVHRPDDANPEEVDKAVTEFLRENHDEFVSRIEKWNPKALDEMRKQSADRKLPPM